MSKKVKCKTGDVVTVPLGAKEFGYGWILGKVLIGFFDFRSVTPSSPVEEVVSHPIVFRIWVMNSAVGSGRWPIVGHSEVPQSLLDEPWFFKKDAINGKLTLLQHGDREVPATVEQCCTLERAAVWSATHVEDRLRDHFAGVPNKWVESMKLKI